MTSITTLITRDIFGIATIILEILGVGVVVSGALISSIIACIEWLRKTPGRHIYRRYRGELSRGILLGLEFLVAADIVNTVVVKPTAQSIGVLSAIVLIRTFLSFTLEVEATGRWPWENKDTDTQTGSL